MTRSRNTYINPHGFTLVELSIVLVVVGLIVGGILVAKQLINTAQLQRIITDFDRWSMAVHIFRNRYGGLPGDITDVSPFTGALAGNGDGLMGNYQLVPGTAYWNEIGYAFIEMRQSGLVDSEYIVFAPVASVIFPRLANDRGGFILVSINSRHYFRTGTNVAAAGQIESWIASFTPADAAFISTKIGNGSPNVGGAVAAPSTNDPVRPVDGSITAQSGDMNGQTNEGALGATDPPSVCWNAASNQWNLTEPGYSCNLLVRINGG